jgi:hypothetical protein
MSCGCSEMDTECKDVDEVLTYLFDFSNFPEIQAGDTITDQEIPEVAGLDIGTPVVTVAVDRGIPAGQAVKVMIGGGTADQDYTLKCKATTSGGAVMVVKGKLEVV